ncbi:phosphomevalonate kinase [Streptomyces qinzhouensis]|uniref:Phosphomevalonate kinase n=1 Tax=Streptomyces qinzhouensis TaxID=2599401 RepID=A0A5B8JF35_9ACTN|nr:phosphomevalonate kinase [Streptomyces qinzhouensis]QDY80395.1 phosphomevalonate kinase [Streptomyces qinzhouensis]
MKAPVRREAPGKLLIAGEYAVLTPGRPALAMAVDRYVTVTAEPAREAEVELATDLVDHPVALYRGRDGLRPHQPRDAAQVRGPLAHLVAVVETTDRLRAESGLGLVSVRLTVRSDLHENGTKLGLGSSGAVTVAAVHALTDFTGACLSAETRFRLALLATVTLDARTSGADLAAGTWGGWVRYSPPDRQALRRLLHRDGLLATLRACWPGLSLHALPPPSTVSPHAGWTGRPASTTAKVGDLQHSAWWQSDAHYRFCARSTRLVDELTNALDHDDPVAVRAAVDAARGLLLGLDQQTGLGIFTPALTALCDAAEAAGGAGKPSGAGGGDCGIAFLPTTGDPDDLHGRWAAAGITSLHLSAAPPQLPSPPSRIGPRPDSTPPASAAPAPRTAP